MGNLDFDIVSDLDIRISDFASLVPLHLSRILDKSHLFMQNKPNLLDAQMNVNFFLTKDYERNDIFAVPENKANSNPIKPNLLNAQMNVNFFLTKDYERNDIFAVPENKANLNPIKASLLDAQMNVSSILTKDYKNVPLRRRGENKPNSNPTCRGVASAASPPRRGEAGSNPISKAKKNAAAYDV